MKVIVFVLSILAALWLTNETQTPGQPSVSYATWLDDGKPWAGLTLEEIRFNLDVSQYLRAWGY